mgnify:CR=1 FL=1
MSENKYALIVFKLSYLFDILYELKNYLNLNVFSEKDLAKLKLNDFSSVILISKKKTNLNFEQLIVNDFPIKINKLSERINLLILKNQFTKKSNFLIGNFKLDINKKTISHNNKTAKLTAKEIDIIIYIMKSKKPVNVDKLESVVWKFRSGLETHTVETHIYRLRKKINENFQINNFIQKDQNGYKLNKIAFKKYQY